MKAFGLLLGAGIFGLVAGQADATLITAYVQLNNGAITQIGTDGGSGSLGYSGTVMDTSNNQFGYNVSAVGSPFAGTNQPDLSTTSINLSGAAAGTMAIYITQTDLTAVPFQFFTGFTTNSFSGAVSSVMESASYDPGNGNGLSGGTSMGTQTFYNPTQATAQYSFPTGLTPGQPYSETVKYLVTFGGKGSANDTITVAGVPEPASWAMMLVGFGLIGATLRQRRPSTVSFG